MSVRFTSSAPLVEQANTCTSEATSALPLSPPHSLTRSLEPPSLQVHLVSFILVVACGQFKCFPTESRNSQMSFCVGTSDLYCCRTATPVRLYYFPEGSNLVAPPVSWELYWRRG